MLTNIAWLGFIVCSGLRMASFVPQLRRILIDGATSPTSSCAAWGLWTCANLSTALYAVVSLNDPWLALVSAAYASCGVTAIALKVLKRLTDAR